MSEKENSNVTRRSALGTSVALAAGVALAPQSILAATNKLPSADQWEELIGNQFEFKKWDPATDQVDHLASQRVTLSDFSVTIDKSSARPSSLPSRTISLLFDSSVSLEGSNYQIAHQSIGALKLLIVGTSDSNCQHGKREYEVIINA